MEIWKEVVGYEGYYEVSNFGNIRSLDRCIVNKYEREIFIKGKTLSKSIGKVTQTYNIRGSKNGYRKSYIRVFLSKGTDKKNFSVHRLVFEAFVGNIDGVMIDHIDNDPLNNRLDNLQVTNNRQNQLKELIRKNGTDGLGTCFDKQYRVWVSRISYKAKTIRLGSFKTREAANFFYELALESIENGRPFFKKHKRELVLVEI
jgi:hypothetical protein